MNWSGKRVFITGHTGFKGGWLSLWLQQRGAELCGFAQAPSTPVNLFEVAAVGQGMQSVIGDIRDYDRLYRAIADFRPEIIFHMAAQPLVRYSYAQPVETYASNVMGTVHLLEAVRAAGSVAAVVIITTDKCYENREWEWAYREIDRLGGYDPYSNSKACAELVVAAYRNSFFNPAEFARHGVAIASVRAGNVIGGGDWSPDRLIPDMIRSFAENSPVQIRSPRAVRPWQHVLEPLRGYLTVAEALCEHGPLYGESWNFGPAQSDSRPVAWVAEKLASLWGAGAQWELDDSPQVHEAQTLRLDCSKAAWRLGWQPALDLGQALEYTADWYKAHLAGQPMRDKTIQQIEAYQKLSQI